MLVFYAASAAYNIHVYISQRDDIKLCPAQERERDPVSKKTVVKVADYII